MNLWHKTAFFIKEQVSNSGAIQKVFKLEPPFQNHEYVIVSGVDSSKITSLSITLFNEILGEETYIFPSDKDGNISGWSELEGSFKGSIDHAKALENIGYKIAASS